MRSLSPSSRVLGVLTAALAVALFPAAPAQAAGPNDPARFLEVEAWDAVFTFTAGGSHASGSFSRKVELQANSRGTLGPFWSNDSRASWRGRPVENTGSVLEDQQTYTQRDLYRGAGNSRPDQSQYGLGALTIDTNARTFEMSIFSTVIRVKHTNTVVGGGSTVEDEEYHVIQGQAREFFFEKFPLPRTGLELQGRKEVRGSGYLSELGDIPNATWVMTWKLTPRVTRPQVEIDAVSTPAFEEGKHSFITTDPISIRAGVSGVREGQNAVVLWTVTGKGPAAVAGFPRNWTTPVVGGAAEFRFRPADNPTLVKNRREQWATAARTPNPPLAFEVTARLLVNGAEKDTAEVPDTLLRQDTKDILRQEYADFRLVASEVVVPPRDEVGPPEATGSFAGEEFNGGNYTAPAVVRNGAMQQLAQSTQAITDAPLRINSAFRNPRRNKAVNGVTRSRHMYGDAVDLEPIGESDMKKVERRRAYVDLYRAALAAGADRVLLELGPEALMKANTPISLPGRGQRDKDGDTIPDRLKVKVKGKRVLVWKLFDRASHVHLEKGP